MDTIIFTNILFTTISIFLVFATICLVLLVIYTILVLKSIRYFFNVLKKGSEKIGEDIENVRSTVISMLSFVLSFFKKTKKSK